MANPNKLENIFGATTPKQPTTGNSLENIFANKPTVAPTTAPAVLPTTPAPVVPAKKTAADNKFEVQQILKNGFTLKKDPVTGKTEMYSPVIDEYRQATPERKAEMQQAEAKSAPIIKMLESETGKKVTGAIAKGTSNLFLKGVAKLQTIGTKDYDEAYQHLLEKRNDPDNNFLEKVLFGAQDTIPQTLIGVGLAFVPYAGPALSGSYFGALSVEEERQKPEGLGASTVGNVAIDVVGDRLLGGMAQKLLKTPAKLLKSTLTNIFKTAGIEGGTEVAQTLLKNANDYKNAKTDEERQAIATRTKEYVTNGDMALEFTVGAAAGGLVGAGVEAIAKATNQTTIPATELKDVEATVDRHISEAQDVVRETPDFVAQNKLDFIKQTQTNIVDGLRAEGHVEASEAIAKIDPATIDTVEALQIQAKALVEAPVAKPSKPAEIPTVNVQTEEQEDKEKALQNIFAKPVVPEGAVKLKVKSLENIFEEKKTTPEVAEKPVKAVTETKVEVTQPTLVHYTSPENAEKIKATGFQLPKRSLGSYVAPKMLGEGIYFFTKDAPEVGKSFGAERMEATLKDDAKIFDASSAGNVTKDGIILDNTFEKLIAALRQEATTQGKDTGAFARFMTRNVSRASLPEMVKGLGYDGVKLGDELVVYRPEQIVSRKIVVKKSLKKATPTTVLAPSKAKTEEETKAEKEKVGVSEYKKPLVEKSDIKKIIEASPEFKKNPVLTVDKDKNLVFKGEKQSFKIKAEALALNPDNLEVGEKITVDIEALKAKGAEQQMRVYRGGNAAASVGAFRPSEPTVSMKTRENVSRIELPEMVDLARNLMGQVPKIREKIGRSFATRGVFKSGGTVGIDLRADLFNPDVNTPDQAAKTLAHEIGHLIDYLPDNTLKRGNLLGRLSVLREFRKDFFLAVGQSRTNQAVTKELWELSKYWKPFDEKAVPQSFIDYRKSAKEIYADFVSVLFNDPVLAQEKAPEAYNIFFEQLDKKPAVRDAYFEIQSLLAGDKSILTKSRREGVRGMFDDGEYKGAELQRKRELEKQDRLKNFWSRLKFDLVSKNYTAIDKVRQLEKQGTKINPDDNPVYYLEERNYIGGKIKAILARDFDPIYQKLNAAGISWEDFGEALFYRRIIDGDRSKVANPRGITPEVAKDLYDDMRRQLGDRFPLIEQSLTDYRNAMLKVTEEAYQEGLYSPEMYHKMKDNPTYATFQVIDHLEDGLSSKVYKSIGTLKDITNPATATIEKMIKTVQAIERNKTNRVYVDFLKANFPSEIKEAKAVFTGKGRRFLDSKKTDEELATFMRNGKSEGYYVDPYIAKTLNNESIGSNLAAIQTIRLFNSSLYRPLFITYNLGFQSFNLIRDFTRFWKNMPNITFGQALKRYGEAGKTAKVRAFGLPENPTPADLEAAKLIQEMELERTLPVTFGDLMAGETYQDKQIDKILDKYGVNPIENLDKGALAKTGRKFLDMILNLGNLIETLPKVAGYNELKSRGEITKEDASFIRRKIGSPDFLDGGYAKPITNEIFLFSNSILQGIRADLEVATDPKTRSGYWVKTAKLSLLPKLLMMAAALGFFGKELKELMDSASEYDKTNYIVVPLGKDKNGKAVYLRIPQDETGRLLGGMFWKTLNMTKNNQSAGRDLLDIVSMLGGQLPSLTPILGSVGATGQYIAGQNPYDFFRGRNVISEDAFNAGGWEAAKQFLGWQFQQMGGGNFMNFTNGQQTPTDKSIPEKIFGAPVISNILGRWVKVSNYGKAEAYNRILDDYAKLEAKTRIEEKEIAKEYANQVVKGEKTAAEANNAMIKEVFGGEPKTEDDQNKAKRLVARFNLNLTRSANDPLINALTYASNNKEKIALLQKAQETMEVNTFVDLLKVLYSDKIIGDTVINGLNQNEK